MASDKASPVKKTVPTKTDGSKKAASKPDETEGKLKEKKQEDNKVSASKKEKDQVVSKVDKENKAEQVKNKKNMKNLFQEKPVDFDEGKLLFIHFLNIFQVYIRRILISFGHCRRLGASLFQEG